MAESHLGRTPTFVVTHGKETKRHSLEQAPPGNNQISEHCMAQLGLIMRFDKPAIRPSYSERGVEARGDKPCNDSAGTTAPTSPTRASASDLHPGQGVQATRSFRRAGNLGNFGDSASDREEATTLTKPIRERIGQRPIVRPEIRVSESPDRGEALVASDEVALPIISIVANERNCWAVSECLFPHATRSNVVKYQGVTRHGDSLGGFVPA
ncbi:hypothetical protein DFP72DRAFT_845999 [Ephemerocybe angulata]|uniref:Uncharacterized protein n=1 Tax=Ephemerocybe angulata TaxID=980116 RepID=A0A8H6M8Q0_9AGAR|nr:hypothetical protein DFP72DRAFT_845999 [Tulosesus angulatus]